MRAGDLARPFPTVQMTTPVSEAATLMASRHLPGLIVVDAAGCPRAILDGTDVLRTAIPTYCQDDPALARVIDEAAADVFLRGVDGHTVADCLSGEERAVPVVAPEATMLEVAALMAGARAAVVAVAESGRPLLGAITLELLLDRMLAA